MQEAKGGAQNPAGAAGSGPAHLESAPEAGPTLAGGEQQLRLVPEWGVYAPAASCSLGAFKRLPGFPSQPCGWAILGVEAHPSKRL